MDNKQAQMRLGEALLRFVLAVIFFVYFFAPWIRWVSPFGVEAQKRAGHVDRPLDGFTSGPKPMPTRLHEDPVFLQGVLVEPSDPYEREQARLKRIEDKVQEEIRREQRAKERRLYP